MKCQLSSIHLLEYSSDFLTFDSLKSVLSTRDKLDQLALVLSREPDEPFSELDRVLQSEDVNEVKEYLDAIIVYVESFSCVDKDTVRHVLRVKQRIMELTGEYSKEVFDRFVGIALATLFQNNLTEYLQCIQNVPHAKELMQFSTFLKHHLTLSDALEVFCDSPELIRFVATEKRSELVSEIQEYFCKYTDDYVRELVTKVLIKDILSSVGGTSDFSEILDKYKARLEVLNKYNVGPLGMKYLNYALGQCKEVLVYEKGVT